MLQNYLKLALRHLLKNRLYTVIKLAGLTLGSATCLLIGLYLHHEITYDGCHEKGARIAKVNLEYGFAGQTVHANVTGSKVAPAFVQDFPEVERAVRVMEYQEVVRYGDQLTEEPHFYYADSTFFEVFTFPLLKGNPKTALAAPHTVVLTERTARRYFGAEDPIGKVLNVGGRRDVLVTGVMADPPANTHLKPDLLRSFTSLSAAKPENESWQNANYATYLLLRHPDQLEKIQGRIPEYMAGKIPESGGGGIRLTFHLQRLRDVHLRSAVPGNFEPNGDIRYLYILGITALLILLIACTTYINLTTAASTERAREVGVQKVLGAGRGQLAGQFLGESAIVTGSALLLGLALTVPLLPLFNGLFDRQLSAEPLFHPTALALIGGIGLLVSLLAKDFLKLVFVAFVLAAPVAWYLMERWLQDFAYRIAMPCWVFLAAGFLAAAVAFLTVGFQSARAALANPVESLRSE